MICKLIANMHRYCKSCRTVWVLFSLKPAEETPCKNTALVLSELSFSVVTFFFFFLTLPMRIFVGFRPCSSCNLSYKVYSHKMAVFIWMQNVNDFILRIRLNVCWKKSQCTRNLEKCPNQAQKIKPNEKSKTIPCMCLSSYQHLSIHCNSTSGRFYFCYCFASMWIHSY